MNGGREKFSLHVSPVPGGPCFSARHEGSPHRLNNLPGHGLSRDYSVSALTGARVTKRAKKMPSS